MGILLKIIRSNMKRTFRNTIFGMEEPKRRRGRSRKSQSNSRELSIYQMKSELEEVRAKIGYFVDS